ncbi:Uncharacterized protein Rs2_08318 [Raphanus sativus]|nr:Uncharacterized protein Rs2_08318 [Raphanus sativus]
MANSIMASSKPLIFLSSSSTQPSRRPPPRQTPPNPQTHLLLPPSSSVFLLRHRKVSSFNSRPGSSLDGRSDGEAQLFDFNLTLPIIVVEFLFLMFALDKVYYFAAGELHGQERRRDQGEAGEHEKETEAEVEEQLAEGRKKVEAELQEALASLEKQKEVTIKALYSQIAALSEDIVKKNRATDAVKTKQSSFKLNGFTDSKLGSVQQGSPTFNRHYYRRFLSLVTPYVCFIQRLSNRRNKGVGDLGELLGLMMFFNITDLVPRNTTVTLQLRELVVIITQPAVLGFYHSLRLRRHYLGVTVSKSLLNNPSKFLFHTQVLSLHCRFCKFRSNMASKISAGKTDDSEYEIIEGGSESALAISTTSPWMNSATLKLRHRIGRGPFGDVWLATHHQSTEDYDEHHEVAIKMLHPIKEDQRKVVVDKFEDCFPSVKELTMYVCSVVSLALVEGYVSS